jgi:hypothetical protein
VYDDELCVLLHVPPFWHGDELQGLVYTYTRSNPAQHSAIT